MSPIVDQPDGSKIGGQIIGINLGWDFVSEHEWGIAGIKRAFGIPDKPERRRGDDGLVCSELVGADVRTITNVPKGLMFIELKDAVFLIFLNSFSLEEPSETWLRRVFGSYQGADELSTAWCDSSFGICLKKIPDVVPTRVMILGQINEAIQNKDAMIFLSGRAPVFGNSGLVIAIRSRIPADVLQKIEDADKSYLDLVDAVEKVERDTGLTGKLKVAGKLYYALSPCWAKDIRSIKDGELQTVHPVMFWLNPCEQQQNSNGYFTVEQLLEWIDGKGPIPIRK